MTSLTWRPSSPPCLLISAAHRLYPRSKAWPSSEKSPDSDKDAPMSSGPEDLLLPPPEDEPHAAMSPQASSAEVPRARNRARCVYGFIPALLPVEELGSVGWASVRRSVGYE